MIDTAEKLNWKHRLTYWSIRSAIENTRSREQTDGLLACSVKTVWEIGTCSKKLAGYRTSRTRWYCGKQKSVS